MRSGSNKCAFRGVSRKRVVKGSSVSARGSWACGSSRLGERPPSISWNSPVQRVRELGALLIFLAGELRVSVSRRLSRL